MSDKFTNSINENTTNDLFTNTGFENTTPENEEVQQTSEPTKNNDKFSNNLNNVKNQSSDGNISIDFDQIVAETEQKGKKSKGKKSKSDTGVTEAPIKEKKGIGKYILWGIVGLILLFIVVKFIKAKTKPAQEQQGSTQTTQSSTTTPTEEALNITNEYSSYLKVLASGENKNFGFSYVNKEYPTETGAIIKYTDVVKAETLINQQAYSNLTKQGKSDVLGDILDISSLLSGSSTFDAEFDTKLIDDISKLSFIDTYTFNAILEKKGRMVDIEIPTDSKYEATLKIFDSVDKVYDVNGSKCKIVGSFCSVTDSKEVTLTLFFEEEGNVSQVPIKIVKETVLERDNKLDNINNGFVQFAYSAKVTDLETNKKYTVLAYTMTGDKTYKEIGSIQITDRTE